MKKAAPPQNNPLLVQAEQSFSALYGQQAHTSPPALPLPAALRLQRQDLPTLEPLLGQALGRFVPFVSHSVYFPPAQQAPDSPQWLPRERTLLLPLVWRGELLGVFTARGADGRVVKRLLPHLPALAELVLHNLELDKRGSRDALTGLALSSLLLERMAADADTVRARFARHAAGVEDEDMGPLYRACMGLMVVRCADWENLAAEHGHLFTDRLTLALAEALQGLVPEGGLAARTGEGEFALLLPGAARGACRKLASALLPALDKVRLPLPAPLAPPHGRKLGVTCVLGHALYPQDMDAPLLPLSMDEQARVLLHKARLAARMAGHRLMASPHGLPVDLRHMAFNALLSEGGVVEKLLPQGRVEISLGRQVGAREGLRFVVSAAANSAHLGSPAHLGNRANPPAQAEEAHSRGEITLVTVGERTSVAHVLHLHDPAEGLMPGDILRLVPERRGKAHAALAEDSSLAQKATALLEADPQDRSHMTWLGQGDFLRLLPRHCEGRAAFGLALLRLGDGSTLEGQEPSPLPRDSEARLSLLEVLARRHLQAQPPLLAARYGERSLAFLLGGGKDGVSAGQEALIQLCRAARAQGLDAALGLAQWPCLQLSRADMLECCRKALDLALLLPERVGMFGSLALHVSADKSYSRGDVFGAVEEYQWALLADKGNGMAWNSLGVCMAALSRHEEARGHFAKALHCWKKALKDAQAGTPPPLWLPAGTTLAAEHAATLYNMGTVCQNVGERRAAGRYFRQCVATDSGHYFARIRLGQWAEEGGRRGLARQYYQEALALEDEGKGQQGGQQTGQRPGQHLARRHLARLAAKQKRRAEARELLHEALLRHPQDAAAMTLLAELCLDGGEDPGMAEMLARRSLAVRPHAGTWLLLARALRAQGRGAEADEAQARAAG